jgi:hypothetical protein
MGFKIICSVCLALACLSAASTAKAQESNKPQYGSWGIDLSAMDPSVKPAYGEGGCCRTSAAGYAGAKGWRVL